MYTRMRVWTTYGIICWLGMATSADALRAQGSVGEEIEEVEGDRLNDPAELEAFIDGVMAAHMPGQKIPTATISVVKDGTLFFAKGYGYADRAKEMPVDPETTLFRPGSISKLFTWTAVMQLVEAGKLDLDADVNQYLKGFQIPETFPEPVTMKHLLTHTPGFEDGGLGYLFIRSADELKPLAESLAAHIPMRVRAPGTYSSYSNWGTALAGLIVSNLSGLSFEEYVETNIFQPLGMTHSTFREPLPEHLAADMAVGYRRKNGVYEAGDFEFIGNFGPAGALTSSAGDMARFMIAHLQNGAYGEGRILGEETARRMHQRLHTLDPRLPGMAHGFYESAIEEERIIGHGGDTILFHSDLALYLDRGVGVFVSYVTNGGQARGELIRAFTRRYFPGSPVPRAEPPEDFGERAGRFTGSYRFTRHNSSTIEKLVALGMTFTISATPENTLLVSGVFPEPSQWVEVEPLLFRQVDGAQMIAFKEDGAGRVTHMALDGLPFMPVYRVPWYGTVGFNLTLLMLGLVTSVSMLVSAAYHRKRTGDAVLPRTPVRVGVLTAFLTLLFAVAAPLIIAQNAEDLIFEIPASFGMVLIIPQLTAILSVIVAILAVLSWKNRHWTTLRRVHYTLFAIGAVGMTWFYFYWNMLGYQY